MTTTLIAGPVVGPRWEWGDRMRKIRRSVANLSQPQMAAMIGIRATTYAAWEAGRTQPSYRIAQAVAQRIESQYPDRVSAAWVLGVGGETADEEILPLAVNHKLLPRMDSNHQPCDLCRVVSELVECQEDFCDVAGNSLETVWEVYPCVNDYQSARVYGKGNPYIGVSGMIYSGGLRG